MIRQVSCDDMLHVKLTPIPGHLSANSHPVMTTTPLARAPARSKNLSQGVVDAIAEQIRDGALRPGDRLPAEPELVLRFGVSRTVVRESMLRLQSSGLVETRHGVGTFVLAPDAPRTLLTPAGDDITTHDMLAMLELRISVETDAAGLAASRRTEAHLTAMRAALDAFGAAHHAGASTVEADFQFHLQIAMATGNRYFEEVLRGLGDTTIERRRGSADKPQFGETHPLLEHGKLLTLREHEDIYACVRRGDPAAARAAMLMHLSNSRERKQRIINP